MIGLELKKVKENDLGYDTIKILDRVLQYTRNYEVICENKIYHQTAYFYFFVILGEGKEVFQIEEDEILDYICNGYYELK